MALHLNGLGGAIERTLMHMCTCGAAIGKVYLIRVEIHRNEFKIHVAVVRNHIKYPIISKFEDVAALDHRFQ